MARILKQAGSPIRVLVVWEPVLLTDVFRRSDRTLVAQIPDSAASHYWDPHRALSGEVLRSEWTKKYAVRGGPRGIVWDWVACYAPGALWKDGFPEPALQRFPVVDGADDVHRWLELTSRPRP